MGKITYADKVALNTNSGIADNNKCNATDMNEIKEVVNENNPIGEIKIWSTSTAPSGFLLCDGTAVSRTTYADLFAVIGTTYGVGDNSTTFNVPNLKGRTIVGIDSTQDEFDNIGKTGGAKTHTLTEAQIPAHKHRNSNYVVASTAPGYGNWLKNVSTEGGGDLVYLASADTKNTGGGQPHNNLPPYIALNYIIKT